MAEVGAEAGIAELVLAPAFGVVAMLLDDSVAAGEAAEGAEASGEAEDEEAPPFESSHGFGGAGGMCVGSLVNA